MSSFFSCTGKKNPFRRSKKNKKKEPEDVYRKIAPTFEEEPQVDERKPPSDDHIPEVKINGGEVICGQCQENSDTQQSKNEDSEETQEPSSPFLKELQEKLQERDKDKVVEEKIVPVNKSTADCAPEKKVISNLERQLSESKTRPREEADLEVELLKAMLKKIENENEKLQNNLKGLEDQYFRTKSECDNKIERVRSENRILRKENDGLLEENENLKISVSNSKLNNRNENQDMVKSDIIQNEETMTELTFRVQSVSDEREEILTAIDSLVNVCSALEPRLESLEQTTTIPKSQQKTDSEVSISSRLDTINGEHENLNEALKSLMKRLQELECRIIELEVNATDSNEITEMESNMASRIEQTDAYLGQLQVELEQTRDSCLLLQQTLKTSESDRERLSSETGKLKMENEEHKQHIEDLQSILEMREAQLDKQKETKNMVKENIQLSAKCQEFSTQLKEKQRSCEMLSSQLADMRSIYDELYVKYNELSSNHSPCQSPPRNGHSLNNGSVVEEVKLEDTSSPVTIAERFQKELFSNDWGHAYEKLTTVCRRDEKKTLQILLDFCTEGYLHCRRTSRQQLDMICSVLCTPSSSHVRSGLSRRSSTSKLNIDMLPKTLRQQIISFRRKPTKEFLHQLYEDFMSQLDFDKSRHLRNVHEREVQEIAPYICKCLEICWEMVVQDPPMYLQFKLRHGSEIETEKYSYFSNPGSKADYLVWPALLREENGAVLQKGVIQAIPDRP